VADLKRGVTGILQYYTDISNSQGGENEYEWLSSGILRRAVPQKLTDVSKVLTTSVIRGIHHLVSLYRRPISARLHSTRSQKTVIFML
jgi:hypothetical protein